MDQRAVRRGHNEALFRNVNERLERLNETFATVTDLYEIVCECGNSECSELIRLEPATYARIRDDASLFIVVPGHEELTLESVVEQHGDYEIIRKKPGLPEEIARATEPRP